MKSNTRNEDVLISFGQHLKKLRESKNISQAQLGLLVDSYQSSIQRIEYGQSNPELCMLVAISNALDIKLSELMDFNYEIKSVD